MTCLHLDCSPGGRRNHSGRGAAEWNGQWQVRLEEYVFAGEFDEVLLFPFALEVARHTGDRCIAITDVRVDEACDVSFVVSLDATDSAWVLLTSAGTE